MLELAVVVAADGSAAHGRQMDGAAARQRQFTLGALLDDYGIRKSCDRRLPDRDLARPRIVARPDLIPGVVQHRLTRRDPQRLRLATPDDDACRPRSVQA